MKWESIHAGGAASRGALDCLRYAVEHGCRLKARDIECNEAWDLPRAHLRARAACLLYVHAQGCSLLRRHWQSNIGCTQRHHTAYCVNRCVHLPVLNQCMLC